ncbi:MAG TPA: UDP-N-acetylmuramoyl-L-alanine--D-glutamate ligase [Solirubrobacterales bacterium]|jgi:UDP-N-acetylmuramoylalanine--D-glutamate ligase|nr:UDP-N-acetylmuramoyl-L-alanine--D-glutamate ligase [Solirubrobacterales bacterium]
MSLIPAKEVRPPLPRGPFLVVGLARSGQAAARLLAARGERVRAVDSGHPEGAEGLSALGVEVTLDTDGLAQLEGTHTVVKSPGVPREAAVIAAALERGTSVTGELELAWRALPNRFLAVTGTNGKTTTVELLGHVFRGAGEPVAVAGNVGVPLAGLVGEIEPDATVVCEASSFQLEDTDLFSPEGAVFLNLAPDHLDRHGDLPAYRDAKLRIFANQGNDDVAVWNGDDPELAGVDLGGCARRIEFCRGASPDCEVAASQGTIFYDGEPLVETAELGIPGEHNVENAMAAAAAALSFGIDRDTVVAGLRSFGGVPHRLEPVAEIDGVRFVNDSKATNVAAAVIGIKSFDSGVHAILGGSDKGEPFGALIEPLRERAAACYLLGDTAPRMAAELAPLVDAGVPLHRAGDLEDAVRTAAGAARPGEVVLLSPACASFDAFPNFEARGERFRQIVADLGAERG